MVNKKRDKKANDSIKYFVGTRENLKHAKGVAEHYKTGKIVNIKKAENIN